MEIKLRNINQEDDILAIRAARKYLEAPKEERDKYFNWSVITYSNKHRYHVKETKTGNVIVERISNADD